MILKPGSAEKASLWYHLVRVFLPVQTETKVIKENSVSVGLVALK